MNHATAPVAAHRGRLSTSDRRHRDAAIAARRTQGLSLAAIAEEFGMTRERVRQIVREQGGPGRADVRRIRQAKEATAREALRDRCLEHLSWHPGLTLTELAQALEVEPGDVRDALGSERRRLLAPKPRHVRRATDEDLLGELRLAGGLIRGPLTGAAYDRIARGLGLPSRAHQIQRFGSWARACELAGVTPGKPSRAAYTRRWTAEEMLGWVARYLRQPSCRGTYAGYSDYARRTPDAPSAETVRITIGPWGQVKAAALRLAAEGVPGSSPSIPEPWDLAVDWDEVAGADPAIHQGAMPRHVRRVLL